MEIRKIEPRDFAAVAALENANWTADSTPIEMASSTEKILDNVLKGVVYLLATTDRGEIIGVLDYHVKHSVPAGADVVTFGLMVAKNSRHKGVGKELLQYFLSMAKSESFRKVSIEVLGGNSEAISLYEAAGFAHEGRQKDEFYLNGKYVDNLWYGKFLR